MQLMYVYLRFDISSKILTNSQEFSSHPWPDERLIALNTMKPDDHARLKKYVNKFYSKSKIKKNENFRKNVLEISKKMILKTKKEQEKNENGGVEIMKYIRRIHMASTLSILEVPYNDVSHLKNFSHVFFNQRAINTDTPGDIIITIPT